MAGAVTGLVQELRGIDDVGSLPRPVRGGRRAPTRGAVSVGLADQDLVKRDLLIITRRLGKDHFVGRASSERLRALLDGSSSAVRLKVDHLRRSTSEAKAVLVVWAIDNWSTFHRKEMLAALARHLRDAYDVLIVEPGENFKTTQENGWSSRAELEQFVKLKPEQIDENLYRIRLISRGLQVSSPIAAINRGKLAPAGITQSVIAHIFGTRRRVVHWIYKPDQLKWCPRGHPFVMEVYDDYAVNFATGVQITEMQVAERVALPAAEHVFFTSHPLAERKSGAARSWSVIGNGVAVESFAAYRYSGPRHKTQRPAVGYLGNLSNFFDWEMMLEVAERMPDVDFRFYGPVEWKRLGEQSETAERLGKLPNTLFAGRVGREQGAAAIAECDALIIPFRVNEAMHAVNPLKLWEYFAVGRPVVSTPIAAIEARPPLVRFSCTADDWMRSLRNAITEEDSAIAFERIRLAEAHSWTTLTARHAEILLSLNEFGGEATSPPKWGRPL